MSDGRETDELILNIDRILREYPHAPSNPSIYRVPYCLRSTNSKAYDPMIISIGPFHRGKRHLKDMEKLKMRYLKQLVGESSVDEYVHAIRAKERAAREYYAEEIPLGSDEFVQMLLLDGIFIIEFLLQYGKVNISEEERYGSLVSGFGNVVGLIMQDLMLLENQIPLLVIDLLFDRVKNHNQQKFTGLIWPFLLTSHVPKDMPMNINVDHLLGLVHYVTTLSFSKNLFSSEEDNNVEWENIYSASELKEAGVEFKKAKKDKTSNCLDITVKNKTIYFPELEIADETEALLKNMIAYEHYRPRCEPKYITDYAFFLHCLVQSSKDVELMRGHGIISNLLGGDARVYELIERLGTRFHTSRKFSYANVFHSVNQHCSHRRNRWFAVLRRNHFDNPWTVISLFAAVVCFIKSCNLYMMACMNIYLFDLTILFFFG